MNLSRMLSNWFLIRTSTLKEGGACDFVHWVRKVADIPHEGEHWRGVRVERDNLDVLEDPRAVSAADGHQVDPTT